MPNGQLAVLLASVRAQRPSAFKHVRTTRPPSAPAPLATQAGPPRSDLHGPCTPACITEHADHARSTMMDTDTAAVKTSTWLCGELRSGDKIQMQKTAALGHSKNGELCRPTSKDGHHPMRLMQTRRWIRQIGTTK